MSVLHRKYFGLSPAQSRRAYGMYWDAVVVVTVLLLSSQNQCFFALMAPTKATVEYNGLHPF